MHKIGIVIAGISNGNRNLKSVIINKPIIKWQFMELNILEELNSTHNAIINRFPQMTREISDETDITIIKAPS